MQPVLLSIRAANKAIMADLVENDMHHSFNFSFVIEHADGIVGGG